jgi:hypothetical protein
MQDVGQETLACVRQPIPETQILTAGGAPLRFALGAAIGARSTIWTVFGSKNSDDVYVGARDTLPMAKLSLHQSGIWRRALIEDAAKRVLPAEVDRVLNRWDVPRQFADGWLDAVTIIIPSSSIRRNPEPLKKPKSGTISFYEPDPGSHQVRFDILIKSANAVPLQIENIHAEVGRIKLPSGGCVGVVATELTATDGRVEAGIERLRELSREFVIENVGVEGLREYEKPAGTAWGVGGEDGRPTIIDLGDFRAV